MKSNDPIEVGVRLLISAVFLFILGAAAQHMADVWTVPLQNATAMELLNGGDGGFVLSTSTRQSIEFLRASIWPLMGLFFALKVYRSFK